MMQHPQPVSLSTQEWPWPLNLETYDRSAHLKEEERDELENLVTQNRQLQAPSKLKLRRLLSPLGDAFDYFHTQADPRQLTIRILYLVQPVIKKGRN